MTSRKTDPQPFPTRGTPTGYRDRWDADDDPLIERHLAEYARQLVAARAAATPHHRGPRLPSEAAGEPAVPGDQIVMEP